MWVHTFTNNTEYGFQWRKIAGLVALVTAVYISLNHVKDDNVMSMLYSWQVFTSVCIGLITIPELIKAIETIKNGNNPPKTTD